MLKKIIPIYLLLTFQLFGLEAGKVQWGFNNKVKKQTFNFISFEVLNDSPRIYDSFVSIEPSGIGVQTKITKKLFLNPGQKKVMQFPVFIDSAQSGWELKWEDGGTYVNGPGESQGSFIYLSQGMGAVRLNKGISLFPDMNFPITVSMTDDLEGLVLDHNPDWSPLQKEAFMDWLKKGGEVYLLNDRSGSQPKFTSLMSDLNNSANKFYIGNGKVSREKVSISNFNKPFADTTERFNQYEGDSNDYFQALQLLVKTDHNWTLIYFLIFIYLLVIGPLNFLIGKKTRDWKVPNLFFLLAVAGFSILFSIIGRRGYGEETKLSSFSMADVIEGQSYDVQQWTNIFVTSGDLYSLTHKGSPNLYFSYSEIGKQTLIDMDSNTFTADIPLFSSRRMIHRAKLKGPKFNVEPVPGNDFGSNAVKVSSEEADIDKVWIVRNGTVYRTAKMSGIYELTSQVEEYYNYGGYREDEDAYEEIERLFINQLTNSRKTLFSTNTDTKSNNHLFYVIVRAKTPESFHFEKGGNIPGEESGWTYYRILINTDRAK